MSKKESPLCQEIGPKKYRERIEKSNAFYDKHKAGRTDPKTGIKYAEISFTDPRARKVKLKTIGSCCCLNPDCENYFSISRTTQMVLCSSCSTLHNINHDRLTDEFTVEIKTLGKYEPR